jgi:hypothetical protein
MQLTRITATLGAFALGGVLVASTTSMGASASADHQRPAHARITLHGAFFAPAPNKFDPNSSVPRGLHCWSTRMSL